MLGLLGLALSVPDHSTLSRRGRAFAGRQPRVQTSNAQSTWCWTAQVWSCSAKASGMPRSTGECAGSGASFTSPSAAHVLTEGHADDAAQVPALLGQAEGIIASVTADGAYDGEPTYAAAAARQRHPPPEIVVPPRARRCQAQTKATASRASVTATSGSWSRAAAWVGRRRPGTAGGTRRKQQWRDTNT